LIRARILAGFEGFRGFEGWRFIGWILGFARLGFGDPRADDWSRAGGRVSEGFPEVDRSCVRVL
jgi:hypothetical protein